MQALRIVIVFVWSVSFVLAEGELIDGVTANASSNGEVVVQLDEGKCVTICPKGAKEPRVLISNDGGAILFMVTDRTNPPPVGVLVTAATNVTIMTWRNSISNEVRIVDVNGDGIPDKKVERDNATGMLTTSQPKEVVWELPNPKVPKDTAH